MKLHSQTNKQTDTNTERHIYILETDRQIVRSKERKKDRHTDKQIDR